MNGAALGATTGFVQDRAGLGFTKAARDLIEVGELAEDSADEAGGLVLGFGNFPPHMGRGSP